MAALLKNFFNEEVNIRLSSVGFLLKGVSQNSLNWPEGKQKSYHSVEYDHWNGRNSVSLRPILMVSALEGTPPEASCCAMTWGINLL